MISQMEPKLIKEAIVDNSLVEAMQEELLLFEKNQVWTIVPNPQTQTIIGTKGVQKQTR